MLKQYKKFSLSDNKTETRYKWDNRKQAFRMHVKSFMSHRFRIA